MLCHDLQRWAVSGRVVAWSEFGNQNRRSRTGSKEVSGIVVRGTKGQSYWNNNISNNQLPIFFVLNVFSVQN